MSRAAAIMFSFTMGFMFITGIVVRLWPGGADASALMTLLGGLVAWGCVCWRMFR